MGKPTLISLFAGIGGLDLAAHWAGFETVRFVEKEPFCQKVLAKHWPNVPIDGDVFTSHPPHADVLCGGFPCQPFSVAGNRQGANDERYLLPEMLRIVSEVQPYAVLFENVPGFPSLNNGTEFKYLLGALAEMGFDAEWGHIRASDVGAPHRRERWFCVAYATSGGQPFVKRANRQKRSNIYNGVGEYSPTEPKGVGLWDGIGISSQVSELSNATSAGLEGRNGGEPALGEPTRHNQEIVGDPERSGRSGFTWGRSRTQFTDGYTWTTGATQSRLGGIVDGLPGRLDFCGFPASIGQGSYAYEPPRTVNKTRNRTARVKALGNAVVPQCAYPIFAAIAEWLAEVKATEQAA